MSEVFTTAVMVAVVASAIRPCRCFSRLLVRRSVSEAVFSISVWTGSCCWARSPATTPC